MEPTQITGTFSYDLKDLIEAHFAHRKTRPYFWPVRIGALATIVVVSLTLLSILPVFIISLLAGFRSRDYMLQELNQLGVLFIVILLLLLLLPAVRLVDPLVRWRIRREFKQNQSIHGGEYKLVLDEQGYSIDMPDWSSRMGWSRVGKLYEYKNGFLITYNNGRDYLPVPKRAFRHGTDLPDIGEWLTRVTGKKIIRV